MNTLATTDDALAAAGSAYVEMLAQQFAAVAERGGEITAGPTDAAIIAAALQAFMKRAHLP